MCIPPIVFSPILISPGTYLRKRREAAGLSSADVAAMIVTEPRLLEHDLIYWLDRIEADVVPTTFRTIACLHCCFSFDIEVLEALVAIQLAPATGTIVPPPRLCRVCACSERDSCAPDQTTHIACSWAAEDLCSACADPDAPDDDPDGPGDGEPAQFGIDADDRGDGEAHRGPANDINPQSEEIAA